MLHKQNLLPSVNDVINPNDPAQYFEFIASSDGNAVNFLVGMMMFQMHIMKLTGFVNNHRSIL